MSQTDLNLNEQVSGTLPVAHGGTGQSALVSGNLLLGNGTSAVNQLAPGSSGNVPVSNGSTWVSQALPASGTVTSVSVASANGFAGSVATSTSTPAISISTTITGLLKGNGTAVSAAASGTDYAPATSGTAILMGNGSGGFSSAAAGTNYVAPSGALGTPTSGNLANCTFPTLNQNTTGNAATATYATSAGTATSATTAGSATSATTAGTCSGNAATATKLATARNINGVPFDGSAAITINAVDATAREPAITTGTTSQFWRGDKTWQQIPYSSLTGTPTIPTALTNLDTTVTGAQLNADHTKLAGIATGAEVNVNADWNAGSGDAQILNKPTLGTAAATNTTAYATAAQGTLAASALQPGSALGTPASGNLSNCTFPTLNQSTTGNAATATSALYASYSYSGAVYLNYAVTGSNNGTNTTLGLWIGTTAQYNAIGTPSTSTVYICT